MHELRHYQRTAIDAALKSFRAGQNFTLITAATGAGKTQVFCELIKECLQEFDIKVLILAHRSTLIDQARKRMAGVWPEFADNIGTYCASLKEKDLKTITIGSIQSICRIEDMPFFNLVIIDECHLLPPANNESIYKKTLDSMIAKNQRLRVLGFTATPFRLGHGYIYGERCKEGNSNWFPNAPVAKIGIEQLIVEGFLCRYKYYVGVKAEQRATKQALYGIKKQGGDFQMADAGRELSKQIHVKSAIELWRKYAPTAKKTAVFCCTIEHAEMVKQAFTDSGQVVSIIHSMMTDKERNDNMLAYTKGNASMMINVNVLTEGWDYPPTDCILVLRPTLSAAIHVQICGRGLRTHEGKEYCTIIDAVGNYARLGEISDPYVHVPGITKKGDHIDVEPKVCDECGIACGRRLVCESCGAKLYSESRENEARLIKPDVFDGSILAIKANIYEAKDGGKGIKISLVLQVGATIKKIFMFYRGAYATGLLLMLGLDGHGDQTKVCEIINKNALRLRKKVVKIEKKNNFYRLA